MVKLQRFDTAQHLDNPEVISHYLTEALESPKLFLRAVQNVARANNMSKIAREIGMSRTSLYWRENTSPEFTTVVKLLDTFGLRLLVEPIAKRLPAASGLLFSPPEPSVLPVYASLSPIRSMKARAKKLDAFLGVTKTKRAKKRAAKRRKKR